MKLRFSGKEYRGADPITGKDIVARAGDEIELSDHKAAQLLKDYPKHWVKPEEASAPIQESPTITSAPTAHLEPQAPIHAAPVEKPTQPRAKPKKKGRK